MIRSDKTEGEVMYEALAGGLSFKVSWEMC
jgi:hypothetical protein